MIDLSGRTAIVTGASRGIGRAIALKLAAQGAHVVAAARGEHARGVSDEIVAGGGKAEWVALDVTEAGSPERVIASTIETHGRIDILVNVAGGLVARKTVAEMDEAFWDSVIALNLKSTFLVTKAALPFFPDGGSIVNFYSQAARDGGGPGASA